MTIALLLCALGLLLLVIAKLERISMQLNQLGPALVAIDGQVTAVKTSFDNFVAALGSQPLPADAQTALTQLQTDMTALSTDVAAATAPATTTPAKA